MDTLERKIREYNSGSRIAGIYLAKYIRLEKDGSFLSQHKITIDEGKILQNNVEVDRPDFIKFAFTL
ncbi:MAG: hypothetical protein ACUZ8H_15820 [Candidatus Anammoxibacter sp.]